KGVMVEHRSVIHYLFAFSWEFDITSADTVLQQASFCFDVFVEEVYPILLAGGKIAIPRRNVVKDIGLLCNFISRNKVTIIDCSPLLLNELNKPGALQYLESVRIFISGGDVLKGEYIDNLVKIGNVYNTYGPTEATVCATYYKCPDEVKANIPIGKPITNYVVHILDGNGQLLPIGVPGELCIGGGGTARGYLNRPELTADKFNKSYKTDILYKTGDLCLWLPDGNIEFLGRIDNQVKIRGYRIESGEIENRLLHHPDIIDTAVIVKVNKNGGNHLCAYIVPAPGMPSDSPHSTKLREFLSKTLPTYMLPSHFAVVDKIPYTSHGKIDRKALLKVDALAETGTEYVAPGNEIEEKLADMWSLLLGIEKVGVNDDFFVLGGDSLSAITFCGRIHKELDTRVPVAEFFLSPTIKKLSEYIAGNSGESSRFDSIKPVEKKQYYPLSSVQKRMYLLQQMSAGGKSYNLPVAVVLEGEIGRERLSRSFTQLIKRHESLRTSFIMSAGEPVQRIHDEAVLNIEYYETGEKEPHRIVTDFIRAFEPDRAPLLRVGLIMLGKAEHILIVDMHHIISDGVSMGLLVHDFAAFFE
ncbi:MAG: AMP-binding protein, partial [bacterium]|nr:AMP-binding protein [bacterium]